MIVLIPTGGQPLSGEVGFSPGCTESFKCFKEHYPNSSGLAWRDGVVFPNVAQFICHFHFLKVLGNDLFGEEYEIIRRRLKHHGIQTTLRKRIRALDKSIGVNRQEHREAFVDSLQTDSALAARAAES
ncbi:MAG: hypothetical protein CL911_05010, partial [Deltaproteobacteria bacterium]|nr:hypothetical protein [Deltaproteobacteria bacterium]